MNIIKKSPLAIFLIFIATSVFANQTTIKYIPSMSHKLFNWNFSSLDDGMVFLLGPESKKKLIINIHPTKYGRKSDYVTVNCNASTYRLSAGASLTCYGNFNDVILMYIAPEDFKNGAKGTYNYKRTH